MFTAGPRKARYNQGLRGGAVRRISDICTEGRFPDEPEANSELARAKHIEATMDDFLRCLAWTMQWEDPRLAYAVTSDNKGQVLSGINSVKWPADFARIAALPQAERPGAVAAFYRRCFYNQWLAQLGIEIQKRAFDCGVNEGSGVAIKVLQESVNVVRKTAPFIAEDGLWGPATVAAANSVDQVALVATFIKGRCARYRQIVVVNPADEPYLAEWLARAQA